MFRPLRLPTLRHPTLPAVLVFLLTCTSRAVAADAGPERPLVLLVNGIVEDHTKPSQVWGQLAASDDPDSKNQGPSHWNGMIGFLEEAGYRFGGTLRPKRCAIELPRDLDRSGVRVRSAAADCFWLQFTENAATDGLAIKAMELASAIARLREFTGRTKVYLVTHSAGGLVARAYLQSAFADHLSFRHDVDRLITISAPHLGSALAEHWGDWLGTRATSLKTTASLLADLNDELDLPADVCFASIIVRGVWTDTSGAGADYDRLVDQEFLTPLPIDFREGGDQVLSVRTQNLRLARCAARYEASTGRAVQYVVARVRKNSAERIHTAALADRQVQEWVRLLLADDGQCWQGFTTDERRRALARPAGRRLHVFAPRRAGAIRPLGRWTGGRQATNRLRRHRRRRAALPVSRRSHLAAAHDRPVRP